jgi:hypothetical protein
MQGKVTTLKDNMAAAQREVDLLKAELEDVKASSGKTEVWSNSRNYLCIVGNLPSALDVKLYIYVLYLIQFKHLYQFFH